MTKKRHLLLSNVHNQEVLHFLWCNITSAKNLGKMDFVTASGCRVVAEDVPEGCRYRQVLCRCSARPWAARRARRESSTRRQRPLHRERLATVMSLVKHRGRLAWRSGNSNIRSNGRPVRREGHCKRQAFKQKWLWTWVQIKWEAPVLPLCVLISVTARKEKREQKCKMGSWAIFIFFC